MLFMKLDDDYTYLASRALSVRTDRLLHAGPVAAPSCAPGGGVKRNQLIALYDRATSEFDLVYFQSFADFAQDVVLWGRLCLPLRMKEGG